MSLLELQGVTKTYTGISETVHAARRVSFTIEPEEIMVLNGPSGAGKSTLLLLAAGAERPDGGKVLYNGQDLAALTAAELSRYRREEVGVAYQHPQLLPGHDAQSNVAVKLLSGRSSVKDARLEALLPLAKVKLAARLSHRPGQLSGGEQRRVALARALVGDPSLLLLDEPTANLDSATSTAILDLIAEAAAAGAGVLLVTHDRAAARIATQMRELRDGQLFTPGQEQIA